MQMVLKMRAMPQPVIAAVNGAAAGAGMNIALAADIRIASEEASFGQNFAKVGLFPDYGGQVFLPPPICPPQSSGVFFIRGVGCLRTKPAPFVLQHAGSPAPPRTE